MGLLVDYRNIERHDLRTHMNRRGRFDRRGTLAPEQRRGEKESDQPTVEDLGDTCPGDYFPYDPYDEDDSIPAHRGTIAALSRS